MTDAPETEKLNGRLDYSLTDAYLLMTQHARKLERERDGWREAAYSLAESLPPSWEELQPPAEQLRKFKEMVALQNKEAEQKLLDRADKHSRMYP